MRKIILLVLALTIGYLSSAQDAFFQKDDDTVYTKVDQMPYFIGCEAFENGSVEKRNCSNLELVNFLSRYLDYPNQALEEGTEGTVYVSFIIEKNGLPSQLTLLNDIGSNCGRSAIMVIEEMPRWEPGIQDGNPVRVKMNLPIQFHLRPVNNGHSDKYNLSWGSLHSQRVTKDALLKNLSNQLYVRGPEGGNRYVDEWELVYVKDKRTISASSRTNISSSMAKVVEKAKPGGTITITASIQDEGEFLTVSRTFEIVRQ